jgi:hypothetical protein
MHGGATIKIIACSFNHCCSENERVPSECIVEPNLKVSNVNILSVAQKFFQGEFISHVKINGT